MSSMIYQYRIGKRKGKMLGILLQKNDKIGRCCAASESNVQNMVHTISVATFIS